VLLDITLAGANTSEFLRLFNENIRKEVLENPNMLRDFT
jgi:hypothetical protein